MKQKTDIRMTPERRSILDQVARYRLTTFRAVSRLSSMNNVPHGKIKSLLSGLCQSELLCKQSLYGNLGCYHLGPAAAVAGNSSENGSSRRFRPLSEQAKIHNYSILSFCCLSAVRRQRLTRDEMSEHFGTIARPGLPMNYYIDASDSNPRLGFLRIDCGGPARWDRVLAKFTTDIKRHFVDRSFQPFIARSQFEVSLVTALPQKATRLKDSLRELKDMPPIPVNVVAFPELLNLIAPPPMIPGR